MDALTEAQALSKGNGRTAVADRRMLREHPYEAASRASKQRAMREPRTLHELLVWFLAGWAQEVPERIHVTDVWRGRPPRTDADGRPIEDVGLYDPETAMLVAGGDALTGGSQLGTPRHSEPMRQFIENTAHQTEEVTPADYEGAAFRAYVRPMRAALERMKGRRSGPGPFMARYCEAVARTGDWQTPLEAKPYLTFGQHAQEVYAQQALRTLWEEWSAEPLPRPRDAA